MVINNKRNKRVSFDAIEIGEVFILCEDVFMKIEPVDDSYCNIYNAVNLANGNLDTCDGDIAVQPINCELVIE